MKIKINVFSSSKLIAAFAAAVLVFAASFIPFVELTNRHLLDLSFKIRGSEKPHKDIFLIGITDNDIQTMGSWPWPRLYYAQLLKIIQPLNPRAVFFDIIFADPSDNQNDLAFAKALEESGKSVLSYYFDAFPPDEDSSAVMPIPAFRDKSKEVVYVNSINDSDGNLRGLIPYFEYNDKKHIGPAYALSRTHPDFDPETFYDVTDSGKEVLVNFPGKFENFNGLPFLEIVRKDVEKGKVGLEFLRDKIILIGHFAVGFALDIKPTVFNPKYPGVGIHASMIHTILNKLYIQRIPHAIHFLLLFAFAYLILMISANSNPLRGFLYALSAVIIFFEINQLIFQYARWWIPMTGFFVIGSFLYLGMTLVQFVRVRIEKEVLGRELSLATKIQTSFLPSELPEVEGIKIAASTVPAKHVGGDLYDLIKLDDDKIGVCIGDVSGKGIPAALYMAKSISEFRREAETHDPAVTVANLNEKLASEDSGGLFLTMLYVVIHLKEKKITYANGGHDPLFYYDKKEDKVYDYLNDSGLPLGIAPIGDFDLKERHYSSGDFFLIETDGIKEAMNPKREQFGMERLVKAMMEKKEAEDPNEIIENVKKHIARFVKTAPVHDDSTMVCVKFL